MASTSASSEKNANGILRDEDIGGVAVFERCSPSTCNIATSARSEETTSSTPGRGGRAGEDGAWEDGEEDGTQPQSRQRRRERQQQQQRQERRPGGGDARPKKSLGLGSGIVWDEHGHILTNYHVISGSNAQSVTLHDGAQYNGSVVGIAPDMDLALLKIDAPRESLKPLKVGSSKKVRVGQRVYAIGSPFGLQQTLTAGIVSGLKRSMVTLNGRTIYGVVQTDAAINPGSSGGPLLNGRGDLIGVNTMIASSSGSNAGVGFAIPVDAVLRIVRQLLKFGEPRTASLGVICASREQARKLGTDEGALVMSVLEGSGAKRAGIRGTLCAPEGSGDAILAVNGERVASVEGLVQIIETYEVGDEVTLTIRRGGVQQQVCVVLQARKPTKGVIGKPTVRSRL